MIPEQKVKTIISNQGKYYEGIGLGSFKQGTVIEVPVNLLAPNSNKKVIYICDHCGKTDCRQFQLLNKQLIHLCYECSRIHIGKTTDYSNVAKASSTRCGKLHPRYNPRRKEFQRYAGRVHSYTRQHFRKELHQMENFDKLGRCGAAGAYQIDHIISIKYGFDNNIDHKMIADISNVRIIPWKENRDKW